MPGGQRSSLQRCEERCWWQVALASLALVINLPGADRAQARELAEAAHQRCPYSRATRGNISVELPVP